MSSRKRCFLLNRSVLRAGFWLAVACLASVGILAGEPPSPRPVKKGGTPEVKPPVVGDWAIWRVSMPEWRDMKELWNGVTLTKTPPEIGNSITVRLTIETLGGDEPRFRVDILSGETILLSRGGQSLPSFFVLPEKGVTLTSASAVQYPFGSAQLEALRTRWEYEKPKSLLELVTCKAVPIGPISVRCAGLEVDLLAFGDASGREMRDASLEKTGDTHGTGSAGASSGAKKQ